MTDFFLRFVDLPEEEGSLFSNESRMESEVASNRLCTTTSLIDFDARVHFSHNGKSDDMRGKADT